MARSIHAQLKDAEKLMNKRASGAAGGLMLEFAKRVVLRTPVKTGRARANWQAAEGSPDRTVTQQTDKAGTITFTRAAAMFRQVGIDRKLYFTNSLPYILPLEFGHSKQAPGGMVRLTIAELDSIARQIAGRS